MDATNARAWKIVLIVSAIVTILSIISLPSLYENISGDSIPNRPQKEPPIEYQWDQAILRILIAVTAAAIGVISLNKIRALGATIRS